MVEAKQITKVVFGHSTQSGWRKFLYLSPVHSFLRRCLPVDVHVITYPRK